MTVDLYCGDCLEVMRTLPNNSVSLIVTDPPYFKVKGDWWDRQWDTPQGFIEWMGKLCAESHRILKPNGSLYVFASPKMAARVECKIGESFNVLNHIVWWKTNGNRNWSADKSQVRGFLPNTERIIFAEHYGADNIAKGEAGYEAKCDELRGFVFEPLRAYLDGERQRAGISFEQVRGIVGCASGSGLPSHWFTASQWMLPTEENYLKLRNGFSSLDHGGAYLTREYEDLRREYEDLRRPFTVSVDVPYTDVWDFTTVAYYPGKHPCEKPAAMIRHIVTASSKPGAAVLDCFMGSGVTGEVCKDTGRDFIGIDADTKWFNYAKRRIEQAQAQPSLLEALA